MKDMNVLVIGNNYGVCQMFRSRRGNREYHVLLGEETKPDLVVFTGGEDINPALYGETCLVSTIFSANRDKEDLTAWNKYRDTPKVGICRG